MSIENVISCGLLTHGDDTFKPILLNEKVKISIKIPLEFVPKGSINNIPAMVQMMAWRLPATSHYLN